MIRYDTQKGYYTVQYDNNHEEELTHEEIEAYLIPPGKEEYLTRNQSGRQRRKRIEKIHMGIRRRSMGTRSHLL